MGIRNKNDDLAPKADVVGARHSPDESAASNPKSPRGARDSSGRRALSALAKSGRFARHPMQIDEEFDAGPRTQHAFGPTASLHVPPALDADHQFEPDDRLDVIALPADHTEITRQAALVIEHEATIARLSSLLAECQTEISNLREDLTTHQKRLNSLNHTISDRDYEVRNLREALDRAENESAHQTATLLRSLQETEAQRESAHRQNDDQKIIESLRRTLANTESQRRANATELILSAQREAEAEQEVILLRTALSDLTAARDSQLHELREKLSHRDLEAAALDTALLERETEWASLHEILIKSDIESRKLTEELRRALLHSEAQREEDAASMLEIMAQREAAESAERANELTRHRGAGY